MNDDRLVMRSLDALDDVFYVYDAQGLLTRWNAALEELFGLSEAELAGMAPTEFFIPADRPQVEQAVGEVFEHGQTVVEAWAETERGRIRFELTGQRLEDEQGELLGFSGIGRDVTAVREREWQLERQNDRLAAFADVLAHDLRNPLQVAVTRVEFEREHRDSDSLAAVSTALDRIRAIIDDVLTIARQGESVTETVQVNLAGVAADAWASVETADADLVLETDRHVEGHPERIQRLFENLFRNSVEHAGPDVTVTVEDTEAGFAVADDGPGIPADLAETVFEVGFSDASTGTGFGLSIVRNLAEAHGWAVTVGESAVGAKFEFDTSGIVVDGGTPRLEGFSETQGGRGE